MQQSVEVVVHAVEDVASLDHGWGVLAMEATVLEIEPGLDLSPDLIDPWISKSRLKIIKPRILVVAWP
jgi:hypothetical protein